MKKVFDQTVRDIKREVNKKVLKVPGIEQKVLDATSNEPWGPHGTLLAEIAQASRNYHEYQMIMTVIWKRINDTGKNWRHVYKALTVLEYLVGHGSERVIDEIREHAYQISTLSEFQYIDSSGRDQGSNVRKKSQSLVVLVNDKERIIEVRQKAAANRDKFRSASGAAMYKPGSYSSAGGYGERYDDDRYESRYGSRDDDRNGYGYGRDRDYSYKDDDRYGRFGDSNSRDGDRYSRDEDRYSRDGYGDDEYRGRSRSTERGYDDDGHSSSRGRGVRADDQSMDGRKLERKFSEQNIAPPSYEEAVNGSRSPGDRERNGEESSPPPAPIDASPPAPKPASPAAAPAPSQATTALPTRQADVVDEFDPRGPGLAGPTATPAPAVNPNNAEMDLLGSLSDSFAANPLAIMPMTSEADANFSGSTSTATHQAVHTMNQPFGDPFGDSPFKAIPTSVEQTSPFQPNQNTEMPPTMSQETANNSPFGEAFFAENYSATTFPPTSSNPQSMPQELSTSNQDTDILADILPPSGPSPLGGFPSMPSQPAEPAANIHATYNSQPPVAPNTIPQVSQFTGGNFLPHGSPAPEFNGGNFLPSQGSGQFAPSEPTSQFNNPQFVPQQSTGLAVSQPAQYTPGGPTPQSNTGNFLPQGPTQAYSSATTQTLSPQLNNGNYMSQPGLGNYYSQGTNIPTGSQPSLTSSTGALALVSQPPKDKFETKSTVWADTLSRGLVNLNISGPKTNPLADIGVDFDAINRKEKRMEKQPSVAPVSTVAMGKAMGSGSGMGRAGAGALRPSNPMGGIPGSGMGMGMGVPGSGMGMGRGPGSGMGMGGVPGSGMGMGMGMGGYGGMNQPGGMNMGMGMGMGRPMGMGPGMQPPGSGMPGGYNPMMGGYGQQPYGGGYR